ncbi:MAG TPA: hypothetical protein VLK36_13175 [Gaiellaceae bacterium]|nr:hypothetical protein [Gaiellaceae bacterium]
MWALRELTRLLEKIALAVLIAIVIAELRTLVAGGDRVHTFQVSLIIVGAVLMMMAAVGPGTNYERDLSVMGRYWGSRSGVKDTGEPRGPVLTANAVLLLSGAVAIVLGFLV